MAKQNDLIKIIDDLPFIVKLILCIPAIDIVWGVYRVIKYAQPLNPIMLVLGILTIVPGAACMWLVDFIWLLLFKKPFLG